jgi:hypothetical protein
MFQRLDIATLAVQGLASAGAGAAQEYTWRRWASMGPLVTAGFVIAGVAMKMFFRGAMMSHVSDGIFMSGASVAGWETSKRVLKLPAGAVVGPTAYRGALPPAYNPQYTPSYNQAQPRMMPASPAPAMRMPQASISGMNPNTGEGLLASRV